MAFKFVLFAAFAAVAQAGVLAPAPFAAPLAPAYAKVAAPVVAHAAPVLAKTVAVDADYDPNPQYSYAYDIQDALTGDNKNHVESRSGDVVQGSYSLVDPDGTRRTVEYTADPVNGFNAVVHREPLVVKAAPVVAKVAAPVAYAAPVAKFAHPIPAPVAYAAPVAKYAAPIAPLAYAAPVAKFAAPVGHLAYAAPVAKTFIH